MGLSTRLGRLKFIYVVNLNEWKFFSLKLIYLLIGLKILSFNCLFFERINMKITY